MLFSVEFVDSRGPKGLPSQGQPLPEKVYFFKRLSTHSFRYLVAFDKIPRDFALEFHSFSLFQANKKFLKFSLTNIVRDFWEFLADAQAVDGQWF